MKNFFKENKIEYYSLIPIKNCKILKSYLLEKNGFDLSSNVIMFLIPYRSRTTPINLSVYASVKDYHEFVNQLDVKLQNYVNEHYPNGKFKLFADHSPIDEVHATCISGLGFIGDNGLLINEKYSSFVFLAECVTDLSAKDLGLDENQASLEIKECLHCGMCAKHCPTKCISCSTKADCLSSITQKKGSFTKDEEDLILKSGVIWGCDVCQNVCPFTKNSEYSPIDFFSEDVIPLLDKATLNSLSDEELKKRPFSWRGRSIIERNVELYERKE